MSRWKYDVFLSGINVNAAYKGFVDQLYNAFKQNGIRVYRDDGELGYMNLDKVHEKSMVLIVFWRVDFHSLYSYSRDDSKPNLFIEDDHKLRPILYEYSSEPALVENLIECFEESLARYEASHRGKVDQRQRRKALDMKFTVDGWDFIDTRNGYLSFIDGIVTGIRKMVYEESSGRKGFELTTFLERRLSIFWDMKSSPLPTNVNPEDIVKKIKAFVKRKTNNNWEAVDVFVYGHSSAQQNTKLHYSGVTLIYTPHGRKDTMYIALLVDLFKWSRLCPPPSSIMLITGNKYYTKALHALGLLGHKIILPDDDNFWPWSNLVKREDLVATSSSQFEELSMRCKEIEAIDTLDLFIVLDLENCPIPREVPTEDVASNILEFVTDKIDWSFAIIRAYGDFSRIPEEVRVSLEKSGMILINTPHEDKNAADTNAADEAMMIDLFMYSKLVPSPSSIMVITGDRDFATTLHAIGGFGHDIYLAIPSWVDVSESLTSAAKDYWYWSEVATGIDLTGLKG